MIRNPLPCAVFGTILLAASLLLPATATAVPVVDQVLTLLNPVRIVAGCQPLRVDARLVRAAAEHTNDMARRGYFSHTTPEGVTFDQRIRRAGYPKPGAENIARGQTTVQQVVNEWLASPGHHRNIVNCELTATGLAINGTVWTQDFGY